MSEVFSKRPIDFSKYRELLSDDNPKIPDDQITRESFKQNQGDGIGSRPADNLSRKGTKEPCTLDKEKKDDSQQTNKWPKIKNQPIQSEHRPLPSSSKDYIREVLKLFEKEPNYVDAYKEFTELLTAKDFGMLTHGPVIPFKKENVTDEEREYKPNLAGILLKGCEERVKNYSLAWREYTDFIGKHKKATVIKETNESSGQVKGEKSIVSTQETKETAKEKAAHPAGKNKEVEKPIYSEHRPLPSSSKDYIREVLKLFEKDPNYDDAYKEFTELLTAKDFGMLTRGPVVLFKEENVTDEERKYKPKLAGILLAGCKEKVKNSHLAWREYTDFVKKHKKATVLKEINESSGQVEGEKSIVSTQEAKETAEEKAAHPAGKNKEVEKAQPLNLFDLLCKEVNKDSEEFEDAQQDLLYMFTCCSVLESSFPKVDVLRHVTVNIDKPEDVPFVMRERALFRYLVNLKPETFDNYFHDIWREYGTCLIAENLLDLAIKAKGPDRSIYLIVEKRMFFELHSELQKKTEEVDELSTRFASQQLTEGNPNIADLSDIHRPKRLGEMYSQLFDDEWSEAFEALKPYMKKEEEEDDEDEVYPNILTLLHSILEESFTFCKEKSVEQLQKMENKIKEVLKENSVAETTATGKGSKMNEDLSQNRSMLDQTVERHSKELRKAASVETAKIQTQVFMKEKLPGLLPDEKDRQDPRVVSYVTKCVELCWYMCMQDPPMELAVPKKGDTVDKNLFSFHVRKGRLVNCCVWAALLLHKDGPLVCKGYVLPEEKKKKYSRNKYSK